MLFLLKMLKKVSKVAVLRYVSSDIVRDSVYSNKMQSALARIRTLKYLKYLIELVRFEMIN